MVEKKSKTGWIGSCVTDGEYQVRMIRVSARFLANLVKLGVCDDEDADAPLETCVEAICSDVQDYCDELSKDLRDIKGLIGGEETNQEQEVADDRI